MSNGLTWWFCSSICCDSMYVKVDAQMKSVKRNELTAHSALILVYTKTEAKVKEVCKCPSDSLKHYPLRNLISSSISYLSDIVFGNKAIVIKMTLTLFILYKQHQISLSPNFKNTTKDYNIIVITESTSDEQISISIYTPGSFQHSTIKALFQNPQPIVVKSQDGKF